MSKVAKRRSLPVVRWLQVGAATAGIGFALAAAPGIAYAEDGAAPPSSDSAPSAPAESATTPADTGGGDAQDADDVAEAEEADASEPEEDTDEDVEQDVDETVQEPTESEDFEPDEPTVVEAGPEQEQLPAEVVTEDVAEADRSARRGSGEPAEQTTAGAEPAEEAVVADESETPAEPEDVSDDTARSEPAEDGSAATSFVAPATSVTTLDQPSCSCDKPTNIFTAISVGLNRFLTGTANWLSSLPDGPITSLFEGALYLVRRTLFPSSVGVINRPIDVPLYFTNTSQSSGENKLGIWVAMGGSTTPQLFEFDTGSAGLFAAYASVVPTNSPWWGDNVQPTGLSVGVAFDSGLVYQGASVKTSVSLFATQDSCTALVNTGQSLVGQMDQIGTSTSPDEFWNPTGFSVTGAPPVEDAFYGDFGMGLEYREDGITNLISQLDFGWWVKPGFVVHVDPITDEAWMQIGLRWSDVHDRDAMYFDMVADPEAPANARVANSHLKFYALQPFNATINIVDGELPIVTDLDVPILPDTGASTTLHNTDASPDPVAYRDYLVDWTTEHTKGKLYSGYDFFLTATTTSGQQVTFFQFTTAESTDGGRVGVENSANTPPLDPTPKDLYYLNSGRSMFNEYDIIYSLGNRRGGGTIGLLPQGIESSERPRRS